MSRRETEIKVSPEQEGLRLDILLSQYVSSRSQAEKMIKKGWVRHIRAGSYENVKPSQKVKAGECYHFFLKNKISSKEDPLKPYDYDIPILYEDKHILVINKPAGIVVHPGAGHEQDTLVNALVGKVSLSSGVDPLRPGLVHRLDKGVSGLLLLSKTEKAQDFFITQFKSRKIKRIYRTLVLGSVKKHSGSIFSFIGRHPKDRKKFYSFDKEVVGSKKALTHYHIIESFQNDIHHIQCCLETGRTHQIRVHLSSQGLPILGDETYGPGRRQSKAFNGQIALYSAFLEFIHPVGHKLLSFSLPWPEEFHPFIKTLGFSTKGPSSSKAEF